MISQIIAEVELNISSILSNFKSLSKTYIKKKKWAQNIKKKKDQNNYFRVEISKKEQQLHRPKVKRKIDFE